MNEHLYCDTSTSQGRRCLACGSPTGVWRFLDQLGPYCIPCSETMLGAAKLPVFCETWHGEPPDRPPVPVARILPASNGDPALMDVELLLGRTRLARYQNVALEGDDR